MESIYIITGKEIYSKDDKSISFRFEFDSEIDFDLIKDYNYWGRIKKNENGQWFITNGGSEGHRCSGGIKLIDEPKYFNDTVYLMKETEAKEFIEKYSEKLNFKIFHSNKNLYES